jgi:hypothetical protein
MSQVYLCQFPHGRPHARNPSYRNRSLVAENPTFKERPPCWVIERVSLALGMAAIPELIHVSHY